MSEKTKRRRLSFNEKYELIKEVKAGAPKDILLNKYEGGLKSFRPQHEDGSTRQ